MPDRAVVGSMMNVPSFPEKVGEFRGGSSPGGGDPVERLDGWKRIAAHFGRERSTAIRWARDRGLPVHRMPGGRTGTVYAWRHELDHWAGSSAVVQPARKAAAEPIVPGSTLAFPVRVFELRDGILLIVAMIGVAVMLMAAASSAYSITGSDAASAPRTVRPADPTIGGRLLAARDLVAERETDGLERAIGLLEGVTLQAPGFAPGHAGLAEALVLSREFGRRGDGEAFRQARQAAQTAVRLDPGLAAGYRLLGFIDYWADGDFAQARLQFERALALQPDDVLSHFWYGNVLSDHGEHVAALVHLERAGQLEPGSLAIRTDLAWARWAMGDEGTAVAALEGVVRRNPDFAVAHDCLAVIALVNGDEAGYLEHFAQFARSRGDRRLLQRAGELVRAGNAGGEALHAAMLDQAMADVADGSRNRAWAVLVASLQHDRATVLALLQAADRAQEAWGDAALLRHIRAAWPGDAQIAVLLDGRMARAGAGVSPGRSRDWT
ncbi:tetratricopeptide repeat protein [Novosphingobium resinovorum]|uniref:tetratricopeptide repeat protein n=1 Tax=Novosphingobium resinovorum TaxID=158500 RepID=UPI002ED020B9|nr:tetratricopeptide repeat protein [Novosphingobium resinovorum]